MVASATALISILFGVPVRSSGAVIVRIGFRISPPEFNVYPPGESNSTNQLLPRFVSNSNSTDMDFVESPLCTNWSGTGVVSPGATYSTVLSSRWLIATPHCSISTGSCSTRKVFPWTSIISNSTEYSPEGSPLG